MNRHQRDRAQEASLDAENEAEMSVSIYHRAPKARCSRTLQHIDDFEHNRRGDDGNYKGNSEGDDTALLTAD